MGLERIKNNLKLDTLDDPIEWCKDKTKTAKEITKRGKNWYVYIDDFILTINANSFTIITAHKIK